MNARAVVILGRTLALSAGLLGCAPSHRRTSDVRLPELGADIARMVLADQAVQQDVMRRSQAGQTVGPADYARQDSVFAANNVRMSAILTAHGWPGRSASPKPSEDAATLDARRASVGLESISAYIDRAMTAMGRAELCRATRGPELIER